MDVLLCFPNPFFLKRPGEQPKEKIHPSKSNGLVFGTGNYQYKCPTKKIPGSRRSNFRQATYVRLKKKTVDLEPDDPEVDKTLG